MNDKNIYQIHDRLTEERKRLNLTQLELAEKLGISRIHVGNYERGNTSITAKHLEKMGELGADIGYIVTGEKSLHNQAIEPKFSPQEKQLLELFRTASTKAQITAINVLELGQ